jgi:hypothetical protein
MVTATTIVIANLKLTMARLAHFYSTLSPLFRIC